MTTLAGRVALVTGGGRGIGKAITLALAAAGCDVAVNYLSRDADANATAEAVRGLGRRAIAVRGDVSNRGDIPTMLSAVEGALGPLDILANNAGRLRIERLGPMSAES